MSDTIIIETGTRFGLWIVIGDRISKSGRSRLLCRCDCGKEAWVELQSLLRGMSRSCGCLKSKEPNHITHGLSKHPIHHLWHGMIARCYCKSHHKFNRYGGRGIRMCEFLRTTPANLLLLIGERPFNGASIGRINNDGNYSCGSCAECLQLQWPINVRWETATQQARNRSTNRTLTHNGETKSLAQWAEDSGISYWTLKYRANHGLDPFK